MSLSLYKKKRNFADTPEPVTAETKKAGKLIFVVQRHNASHLHYDFRLEMEGVLKSWAVPKGPSLYPKDKRLAMMVEDHPIDYAGFEGMIPQGNYGGGIVEIWDKGTYKLSPENKGTNLEAITNGSIKFILKGKKLKGKFTLIKLRNASLNSWLLIKEKDENAVDTPYNSEDQTAKSSPINKLLKNAAKSKAPDAKPMKVKAAKPVAESKKKVLLKMP